MFLRLAAVQESQSLADVIRREQEGCHPLAFGELENSRCPCGAKTLRGTFEQADSTNVARIVAQQLAAGLLAM